MAGGGVEGPWRTALFVGGLVAIAAAAVVIQRTASRVLRESIAASELEASNEPAPEAPVGPAA